MRLLFLIGRFPEVSETFIWREARSFLAAGSVEIVSTVDGRFDPALFPPEVREVVAATRYRRQDLAEIMGVVVEGLRRPLAVLWLLRFLVDFYPLRRCLSRIYSTLRVRVIVRSTGAEVVHAHWRGPTDVAYLLHRLDGTPYTVFLHAHDIYDEGLGEHRYRPLFVAKLRNADAVFTCTAANVRCLSDAIPGISPQLCYHGVSGAVLAPDTTAKARPTDGTLRLITVGRIAGYKGFEDVPELAGRLVARGVEFTWELIGDGSLRQSVEEEIGRRGLSDRVVVRGAMSNGYVLDQLRRAHIFVFLGKQERGQYGLPNVLIEAAASGACIVSRPLDTLDEIIEPEVTGFVAPDLNAFATVLERLSCDRPHLAEVAAQARERVVDRHCHEANFAEMNRCIRGSLSDSPSAPSPESDSCAARIRGAA